MCLLISGFQQAASLASICHLAIISFTPQYKCLKDYLKPACLSRCLPQGWLLEEDGADSLPSLAMTCTKPKAEYLQSCSYFQETSTSAHLLCTKTTTLRSQGTSLLSLTSIAACTPFLQACLCRPVASFTLGIEGVK